MQKRFSNFVRRPPKAGGIAAPEAKAKSSTKPKPQPPPPRKQAQAVAKAAGSSAAASSAAAAAPKLITAPVAVAKPPPVPLEAQNSSSSSSRSGGSSQRNSRRYVGLQPDALPSVRGIIEFKLHESPRVEDAAGLDCYIRHDRSPSTAPGSKPPRVRRRRWVERSDTTAAHEHEATGKPQEAVRFDWPAPRTGRLSRGAAPSTCRYSVALPRPPVEDLEGTWRPWAWQ